MVKCNFHDFVDEDAPIIEKPAKHFVYLIRLKNDFTIAFYAEAALKKILDNDEKTKGFLCTLTNKKTYRLKTGNPNARVFKYDPYYM